MSGQHLAVQRVGQHGPEAAGEFRSRIRTRAGHRKTLHAERLGPSTVSITLIPSHPEVAALLADVYRLTARERQIVALTIRGHSTTGIARALWLSPYTVQEDLTTPSGRELVAVSDDRSGG